MRYEDELLRKIRAGDIASLDQLVVFYYPEIFRYCILHTRDKQTAEDATQDTFMKAIRYVNVIHYGKFRAYLYKIASSVCVDYYRKRKFVPLPDTLSEQDLNLESIESNASFIWMLESLSDEQREIIILRFAGNMKVREIAEILNEPMRTVQSRLRSALKRIKKELIREGIVNG